MASIAPTGGMLLELNLGGMQVISAQNIPNRTAIFMGTVLAPWPNRLRDGQYELAGQRYEFSELDSENNLNHGLSARANFKVLEHSENKLVLAHQFGSDPGYPFQIKLQVSYLLADDELRVEAIAVNQGLETAPFALGFHPYFLAGESFELSGDFSRRILTDDRMLPNGIEKISGLSYTGGHLDDCYFGAKTAMLKTASGEIEVELGQNMHYFMFYRPSLEVGESLIAIEPMSDPANVFADDIDSVLLAPGEQKIFGFSIRKR